MYKEKAYPQLPEDIREYIETTLVETMADDTSHLELPDIDTQYIEQIEYKSRDGFIADPSNYGGVTIGSSSYGGFMLGTGIFPSEPRVKRDVLDWQDQAHEAIKEEHPELSTDSEEYLDLVDEYITIDGSDVINFEARFLYHGEENGIHTASVSASVNTESPYHRSQYDYAQEVEIEWRTLEDLKRELPKAIEEVNGKIF